MRSEFLYDKSKFRHVLLFYYYSNAFLLPKNNQTLTKYSYDNPLYIISWKYIFILFSSHRSSFPSTSHIFVYIIRGQSSHIQTSSNQMDHSYRRFISSGFLFLYRSFCPPTRCHVTKKAIRRCYQIIHGAFPRISGPSSRSALRARYIYAASNRIWYSRNGVFTDSTNHWR